MNLNDFFIWNIKRNNYRVYASVVSKQEAVNTLNNSQLDYKGVL